MAALKTFLSYIMHKYRIDPDRFSGRISFEIEIKNGEISIVEHNVVSANATRH